MTDSAATPRLRPMTADDIADVIPLLAQMTGQAMTPDQMADRLAFADASPVDWLNVCTVAGQVRGVLALRLREQLERVGRLMEIYLIVTDREARRQGVGRAMMVFAEDAARDHGCEGLFLVSGFKRKDEAHRFYETLGYATTGYRFVKMLDD